MEKPQKGFCGVVPYNPNVFTEDFLTAKLVIEPTTADEKSILEVITKIQTLNENK